MSNPWDALADELLPMFKDSVKDFVETLKPEVEAFLKEKAEEAARETWLANFAPTEEERREARSNLRHLKAQVVMEAADKSIIAAARDFSLLGKVFDVAANFLIQYGAKLLKRL